MILFVLQYKILFQNKTVLITVCLSVYLSVYLFVKDYTFTFHICIAPQQKFS